MSTTTGGVSRIELSYLLKNNMLIKGKGYRGSLSWSSGNSILIETKYTEEEKYMRLIYQITTRYGEKKDLDYTIHFETVPSNLRIGELLYFCCPYNGDKCKILYFNDSGLFISRKAHIENGQRLYYDLQLCSHKQRANNRYFNYQSKIDELFENQNYVKSHYRGKETATAKMLDNWYLLRSHYDQLRWTADYLPKILQRLCPSLND